VQDGANCCLSSEERCRLIEEAFVFHGHLEEVTLQVHVTGVYLVAISCFFVRVSASPSRGAKKKAEEEPEEEAVEIVESTPSKKGKKEAAPAPAPSPKKREVRSKLASCSRLL
jgi:hypothetical protein